MRSCAVGLIALGVCFFAWAQSPAAPADLHSYVTSSMKTFDVPGVAVAIVKDGKIVVAKEYGLRKLGEATPVDEFTMFGIGSNTKAFTTVALAMLRLVVFSSAVYELPAPMPESSADAYNASF